MSRRIVAATAIVGTFLLVAHTVDAFNETPSVQKALLIEPCAFLFQGERSGVPVENSCRDQGYNEIPTFEDIPGGHEDADLNQTSLSGVLYQYFTLDRPGVVYINTVGFEGGYIAIEVYRDSSLGEEARDVAASRIEALGFAPSVDFVLAYVALAGRFYPGIFLTPNGARRLFTSSKTIVHVNASYSTEFNVAAWPGSRCTLGYPGSVTFNNGKTDATTSWGRMAGSEGKANRTCTNAVSGLALQVAGNGASVLAPTVSSISVVPNQRLTLERIPAWVEFDCSMDTTISGRAISGSSSSGECWLDTDPGACLVTGKKWAVNGRVLEFNIEPTKMGSCEIAILGRVKSSGGALLDGNTNPEFSDGRGPNGDKYVVPLMSGVCRQNLASRFSRAWAWRDGSATHVAWLTDAESEATSFRVQGLDDLGGRIDLGVVAAAGSADRSHFYETVVSASGTQFQVLEVAPSGESRYSSPVMMIGSGPEDLTSVRRVNEVSARTKLTSTMPSEQLPIPVANGLPYTTFLFYSSRQDFLDATLPVRDWWLSHHGFTSQTVLGSSDPVECRNAIYSAWLAAVQANSAILPTLVIVGEANQGGMPQRNIVGTFYPPDSGTTCLQLPCASDLMIVDFDSDGLPDAPWTRIVASDLVELSHGVQSALDYYSGQFISPSKVLIFDGDYDGSCYQVSEPRATLLGIQSEFQVQGFPVQILHETSYSCGNYSGRYAAAVSAINGGITELFGIGQVTGRDLLPGYFLQRVDPPYFSIGDLTRRQRIIGEFPTCGVGDIDRDFAVASDYPGIGKRLMTADPAVTTTAVAWLAHMRGGYEPTHLEFARWYVRHRFDPDGGLLQWAYFDAIREFGTSNPEAVDYLRQAGALGWPVLAPGMTLTAVPEESGGVRSWKALRVSPNPFRSRTQITVQQEVSGPLSIAVFDVAGRRICQLAQAESAEPGLKSFDWNGGSDAGDPVSSGIYFVRAITAVSSFQEKILFLK